jgi:hypothetical protein
MKKWVVLIIACLFTNILSQTNVSPQFSELNGMEDQFGNTHLFYRIYTYSENQPPYLYQWSNNIYHWDLNQNVDTFFIDESGWETTMYDPSIKVKDLDFWNNNPAEFIYSGGEHFGPLMSGSAYIKRFDGYLNFFGFYSSSVNYIDISNNNDSLLYSGFYTDPNGIFEEESMIMKSNNGGRSWDFISNDYQFLSLYPFNDSIYFVEDENKWLLRTTDSGNTFNVVYYEPIPDSRFYYDSDQIHIYRKTSDRLIVSDNVGGQFWWWTRYIQAASEFYISLDYSVQGTIYLADKSKILISTDFGESFTLYKQLDRQLVGIYKKPNSNVLYAASKYKIYKITPDSVEVIKSLPIPTEVFNYYPLATGNKWVNLHTVVINPNVYHSVSNTEVLGDSIAPNGKMYYHLVTADNHYLDRIDSLEGKIYRYYDEYSNLSDSEYAVADLLAEVGDSIPSFNPSISAYSYTKLIQIDTFNNWGLSKPRKLYHQVAPGMGVYRFFSFTYDVGPDYTQAGGWYGTSTTTLKGCEINGIVYGDTTLTGIDDEENPIASEIKLEQNYPNPFNPSTVISYRLPVTSNVILKVYDVLGNEITTLVNEEKPAGEYEVEFIAANLPSGIYFYQLKSGSFVETKKMILLK